MSLPANICIGTYDGSVAGMVLDLDKKDEALTLTTKFAYNSHPSAVRSAALHGHTLVTGGADETVRIYDLRRRVEVGTLMHHEGTVSSLVFAHDGPRTLLFCGAADGALSIWRASSSDWPLFKSLKVHRAAITGLAVHPSLKVLLSTAADRSLYMWNLARGKVAFSAKTKEVAAAAVAWAPEGDHYVLAAGQNVTLSDVSGRTVSSFNHDARVAVARFLPRATDAESGGGAAGSRTVLTGADDGFVRVWDSRQSPTEPIRSFKLPARMVDIHVVADLVVAADARGKLSVWDQRRPAQPRIETTIGAAGVSLTCMTAAPTTFVPPVRRTRLDTAQESTAKPDSTEGSASSKGTTRPADNMTASQRKRKKSKLRK